MSVFIGLKTSSNAKKLKISYFFTVYNFKRSEERL